MSLATEIADVFNSVHQSHSPDAPNDAPLADAAVRIGNLLADAGMCNPLRFHEVASMSGLDLTPFLNIDANPFPVPVAGSER